MRSPRASALVTGPSGPSGSSGSFGSSGSSGYTADDERAVVVALARHGREARCPRCGAALDQHDVQPRPGVPYVRRRVHVVCTGCRRSVSVDRRDVERERDAAP